MRIQVTEVQCGGSTVGETAKALIPVGTYKRAVLFVEVKALAGNAGSVFVGAAGTVSATQGYQLDAGESVQLPVESAEVLSIVGSEASQGYTFCDLLERF